MHSPTAHSSMGSPSANPTDSLPGQNPAATQSQFIPHRGDRFAVGFLVITFMLLAAIMLADIVRSLLRW